MKWQDRVDNAAMSGIVYAPQEAVERSVDFTEKLWSLIVTEERQGGGWRLAGGALCGVAFITGIIPVMFFVGFVEGFIAGLRDGFNRTPFFLKDNASNNSPPSTLESIEGMLYGLVCGPLVGLLRTMTEGIGTLTSACQFLAEGNITEFAKNGIKGLATLFLFPIVSIPLGLLSGVVSGWQKGMFGLSMIGKNVVSALDQLNLRKKPPIPKERVKEGVSRFSQTTKNLFRSEKTYESDSNASFCSYSPRRQNKAYFDDVPNNKKFSSKTTIFPSEEAKTNNRCSY